MYLKINIIKNKTQLVKFVGILQNYLAETQ